MAAVGAPPGSERPPGRSSAPELVQLTPRMRRGACSSNTTPIYAQCMASRRSPTPPHAAPGPGYGPAPGHAPSRAIRHRLRTSLVNLPAGSLLDLIHQIGSAAWMLQPVRRHPGREVPRRLHRSSQRHCSGLLRFAALIPFRYFPEKHVAMSQRGSRRPSRPAIVSAGSRPAAICNGSLSINWRPRCAAQVHRRQR